MKEVFGTLADGSEVERVKIQGGGLTAHVLTYGAVIQDLRLDGHAGPLVLGFETFEPYLTKSPFFGAIAGRYANRIRDGHVKIDGLTFQLDTNFIGKHLLHGGRESTGKSLWNVTEQGPDFVTLSQTIPDGHMGFPGTMPVSVTYLLMAPGILDIQISATTDAPTLANFAHHSYFVLDDSGVVGDHDMQIAAETYLPVDNELIPTGEIASVDGTTFDYRTPRPLSQGYPQDHNFCLCDAQREITSVATLHSKKSGVSMNIRTTEPGLQVYDAENVDIDIPGLSGQALKPNSGVAIEPQVWPDANHHTEFPQAILRPGETYRQHTQFVFSRG